MDIKWFTLLPVDVPLVVEDLDREHRPLLARCPGALALLDAALAELPALAHEVEHAAERPSDLLRIQHVRILRGLKTMQETVRMAVVDDRTLPRDLERLLFHRAEALAFARGKNGRSKRRLAALAVSHAND